MKEPETTALFDTRAAAAYLDLSKRTLANLRFAGKGPSFVRLDAHAIRYHVADLAAYATARVMRGEQ